jgi:hypothetical protein
MLKEEFVFLLEEGIQEEGFSNLRKRKVSSKNHALFSCLPFKGFDVDEEINNTMDGTPQDESNGYMCNISNDANNDGTLKRFFSDSMSEGMNEEGNG